MCPTHTRNSFSRDVFFERTLFGRTMIALLLATFLGSTASSQSKGQSNRAPLFPVKAFCVAAPGPENVERFSTFITKELAPRGVNTLVLRIDFNFQFKKHPELIDDRALSKSQIQSLVETCRKHQIRLIPQVNLLGHQSWHTSLGKLLATHPEFDETPHIKLPAQYKWPNEDGLYCKSYCSLHPKVHAVVFACVDEVCDAFQADAFQADAFHAGLDEVFFIGDPNCPRCKTIDTAKLFADEVNRIQSHLAQSNRELWIWGDRLIDGNITGIGEWEASTNGTHNAIDLISKDVVICDWHYDRPEPTAVLFALKGFRVITAAWNRPHIAEQQAVDMANFRRDANPQMKSRYAGMMQTVWSGAEGFMAEMDSQPDNKRDGNDAPQAPSTVACFEKLFAKINALESMDESVKEPKE